jgi:hypothetical protein
MISAEEKRKLMKQFENEPLYWLGAWLKLAAGILVLVVIAAGPWLALHETGRAIAIAGDPVPQAGTMQADSRGAFDRSSQ